MWHSRPSLCYRYLRIFCVEGTQMLVEAAKAKEIE